MYKNEKKFDGTKIRNISTATRKKNFQNSIRVYRCRDRHSRIQSKTIENNTRVNFDNDSFRYSKRWKSTNENTPKKVVKRDRKIRMKLNSTDSEISRKSRRKYRWKNCTRRVFRRLRSTADDWREYGGLSIVYMNDLRGVVCRCCCETRGKIRGIHGGGEGWDDSPPQNTRDFCCDKRPRSRVEIRVGNEGKFRSLPRETFRLRHPVGSPPPTKRARILLR